MQYSKMATLDPSRLEFMMYLDEALREVEKQMPQSQQVKMLKSKFFDLAGSEFDRSILGEVHELTVEEILNKQANGFYNNINPKSIRDELIGWFSEMEHQHRRNNFLKFSESIFQQIECLTNCLVINQQAIDYVINNFNLSFTNNNPITVGSSIFGTKINNSSQLSISFMQSESATITIKFKMALYVYYFDGKVFFSPYKKILDTFTEIRQIRNFFHGFKMSDLEERLLKELSLDYDQIIVNRARSKAYSKFLIYQGFLADFVEGILSAKNYSKFI